MTDTGAAFRDWQRAEDAFKAAPAGTAHFDMVRDIHACRQVYIRATRRLDQRLKLLIRRGKVFKISALC